MPDTNKKEKLQSQNDFIRPEHAETAPAEFEVEKKVEIEKPLEVGEIKKIEMEKEAASAVRSIDPAPQAPVKNADLAQIENILAEDLEDVYFQMPPDKQAEFKQVGEETASKINLLLKETKIKIKKILQLIMVWLKIIPGVNKYFLEQEAKIKTDKLLALREEESVVSDQDKNKI